MNFVAGPLAVVASCDGYTLVYQCYNIIQTTTMLAIISSIESIGGPGRVQRPAPMPWEQVLYGNGTTILEGLVRGVALSEKRRERALHLSGPRRAYDGEPTHLDRT